MLTNNGIPIFHAIKTSGTGTNLKVGGTGQERTWGAPKIFWSCPSTFLALKAQLVLLVSAFVTVSTVWSVSCLLFFYSRCPRAQPFVRVGGGHVPTVPNGVGATDQNS